MSKLFAFFLLFFSVIHFPNIALAQKSLPLDQQSQQVQRTGDAVQVTTQTTSENSNQNQASESSTSSAARSALRNNSSTPSAILFPTQGFAPTLIGYFNWLLSAVMVIAILLVFSQFIIAGFEWITSGGDKSKTDSARQRIIHTFIGVLVLSASYALVQFVAYILGFGSLNDAILGLDRLGD